MCLYGKMTASLNHSKSALQSNMCFTLLLSIKILVLWETLPLLHTDLSKHKVDIPFHILDALSYDVLFRGL